MEMTSKQRVLTALKHCNTDRVPFSLGFGLNPPVKEELRKYLGMKDIREVDGYLLGYSDLRWIKPKYVGPDFRNKTLPDGAGTDIWGVERKAVSYGAGNYNEIAYYPLSDIKSLDELDKHLWPLLEWFDVSELKEATQALNDGNEYAIILGNGNIFETSWYMRGFEKMLMDIVLEPELAWEIMTRVTDFYIAYFKKILQAADGMIDIVLTGDDIGQQDGLLISLDLWESMIKPHHVRMNKALHEYGVKVLYHTDGAIMEALPGLMDMGIDILEAIQFDARGMDPVKMKDLYGDKLCFHGGISVQKTLPLGTVDDVRREVEDRIQVLGKNGGYILAPSHAIQAGTPPENVMEFLKASR